MYDSIGDGYLIDTPDEGKEYLLFFFDVENISVISGSALKAIEGSSEYKEKIAELMHTANQILLSSEKDVDKPSLHI